MLTLVLVALPTALTFWYLLTRNHDRHPPGPLAFPVIGNLPQLAWTGSLTAFASHYRKIYGDVFTFTFGGNKRVVVSGYETMYQLLVKNADYTSNRTARSMTKAIQDIIKQSPGIIWAPFPQWKTLRSFTISTLREEGMGKAAIEPRIHEEVECYIEHFVMPNLGKPFDQQGNISQATCNIVSQMLYGHRFDYDDEKFKTMMTALDETVTLNLRIAMTENLPFSSYFLRETLARERDLNDSVFHAVLQSYIDEHKDSLDVNNPRDVTDRYLIHCQSADDITKDKCFSDANAWVLSFHLYGAGTETTSSALRWALLYMCLHEEVKQRVQVEVDNQIGSGRLATYKDRVNMPYTEAVLLETLRKANIAATSLPHTADKDFNINGVLIPAGADLMLNMSSVLNDETVFEEPDKFKPERYLTGDIALKKQRTIPFGIGRRACPGESLARMELFIFFVTFLQRFNVSLPDGASVTDEPLEYFVRAPKPYELVFTLRQ